MTGNDVLNKFAKIAKDQDVTFMDFLTEAFADAEQIGYLKGYEEGLEAGKVEEHKRWLEGFDFANKTRSAQ